MCPAAHLPGEKGMEGWNGTDQKTVAVSTSPERLKNKKIKKKRKALLCCRELPDMDTGLIIISIIILDEKEWF